MPPLPTIPADWLWAFPVYSRRAIMVTTSSSRGNATQGLLWRLEASTSPIPITLQPGADLVGYNHLQCYHARLIWFFHGRPAEYGNAFQGVRHAFRNGKPLYPWTHLSRRHPRTWHPLPQKDPSKVNLPYLANFGILHLASSTPWCLPRRAACLAITFRDFSF